MDLTITVAADSDVARLASCLRAELTRRYGMDVSGPPPDPASPAVLAWVDEEAVGCVVLDLHADGDAELRTMFVSPEARGSGAARHLLTAIEDIALARNVHTVYLTTGVLQPEAMALYFRAGYHLAACKDPSDPDTRCFRKVLSSARP